MHGSREKERIMELIKIAVYIPVMETFMSKFSRYLRRFYKAVSFLFIPHYVRNPKSDH